MWRDGLVGWVERGETQHKACWRLEGASVFAALNPTYVDKRNRSFGGRYSAPLAFLEQIRVFLFGGR
jgi:hypothetical protein